MSSFTQALFVVVFVVTVVAAIRVTRIRFRWPHIPTGLLSILRSEDGAAYSLNLAITSPFYVMIVCVLIEVTLMLNVQIGVDYAAFCAARSAIVWLPAETAGGSSPPEFEHMVHLAAVQAMTPYASSLDKHRRNDGPRVDQAERAYLDTYDRLTRNRNRLSANYVKSKRRYAAAATSVRFSPSLPVILAGRNKDENVTVIVTYEMPFNIPVVGRIFGERSSAGPGYVRKLTSSATLMLERPRTGNGKLGFEYNSRPIQL